jgi:hypothetical protein
VFKIARSSGTKLVVAMATVALVLTPAIAAPDKSKGRPPAIKVTFDPIASFTPASADPRLAAAFAGRPSIGDFKFTPAPTKGRPSQLRVAIRARADSATQARATEAASASSASPVALTPASYNLGVAVGWRQFAVSGDVAKIKEANPALGGRESAVVGVSYSLNKRVTGRVAVAADRSDGKAMNGLRNPDNYSLDVGGAYSITRNIAVTGGVRYRIDRDRLSALQDDRRDSQAVYVGTAFKF